MRIVSFLPSATEVVYALGLGNELVGVTHECDYPPEAGSKPVVVRSAIDTRGVDPQEVDRAVSRLLRSGESLYLVDEEVLKRLAPDLILTQNLCQVCAPSGNEVERVLKLFAPPPQVQFLTPHSLSEIFENVRQVGEVTGRTRQALELVDRLQTRVKVVERKASGLSRPRVFCMEWLSPPYTAGHWMPELVELAGGVDGLAVKGEDSTRVTWERISDYAPEILVLSPCGFHLNEALQQAHLLTLYPGWTELPAVQRGRVYAVDANSYFARPGPRIVDGLELLAALFHPEQFTWSGPPEAYRNVSLDTPKESV
jgi:iron complex transport system substrate-binding protein